MRSLVVLFALVAVAVAAPSIGHAVAYSVPAAVSHQSRVDVHSSPSVVAAPVHYASYVAEPVVATRAVVGPAVYSGGSAVSHQSRVDVHSSPAVVASAPVVAAEHFVAAPAVVEARSVYAAPVATTYYGGSSVSHQSRLDVHSSPAVVSQHVLTPAVYSTW